MVTAEQFTKEQMDQVVFNRVRETVKKSLGKSGDIGCFQIHKQSLETFKRVLNHDLAPIGYDYSVDAAYWGGGYGDSGLNPYRICVFPVEK